MPEFFACVKGYQRFREHRHRIQRRGTFPSPPERTHSTSTEFLRARRFAGGFIRTRYAPGYVTALMATVLSVTDVAGHSIRGFGHDGFRGRGGRSAGADGVVAAWVSGEKCIFADEGLPGTQCSVSGRIKGGERRSWRSPMTAVLPSIPDVCRQDPTWSRHSD